MASPTTSPLTSPPIVSPSPPSTHKASFRSTHDNDTTFSRHGSLTIPGSAPPHHAHSPLTFESPTAAPQSHPSAFAPTSPSSSISSSSSSDASDIDRILLLASDPHESLILVPPRSSQRLRLRVSLPLPPNPFSHAFNRQLRLSGLQLVRVMARTQGVQCVVGLEEYVLEKAEPLLRAEYEMGLRRREMRGLVRRVGGEGGHGDGVGKINGQKVCKTKVLVGRLDVAADEVWPKRELGMRVRVAEVVARERERRMREIVVDGREGSGINVEEGEQDVVVNSEVESGVEHEDGVEDEGDDELGLLW